MVVWSALALVIAAHIRHAVVRRVLVVLLILVACTAQVANWDGVIRGTRCPSPTGVLTLALALRFAWAPSWGRAAAFVADRTLVLDDPPELFPVLLVLAVGMVVIGWARRQAILWGTVAVSLLAISAYTYAYNLRTDKAWNDTWGFSKSVIAYAYPVGKLRPGRHR